MNKNSSKPVASRSRRRWGLPATLLLVLALAVVVDAPGLWTRSFAERALRAHQPHDALRWIERSKAMSRDERSALLMQLRANLQLNLNSAAYERLQALAALDGAESGELRAFALMIAAQRGDMQAARELLQWQDEYPLPLEAFEAMVRGTLLNGELALAELILNQMEAVGNAPGIIAYQRGRILEVSEEFEDAAASYIDSFELQPLPRAAFRAGVCLYQSREFEKAAEMFRQAIEAPYEACAKIELAACLWESHLLDEAAAALAPALDAEPSELQILYLQLDHYVDQDRAALISSRIQDAQGNAELAVQFSQRVLAYNHRSFEARAILIKNLTALGRTEEADEIAQLQREMISNRERCRDLLIELIDNPNDLDKRCELAELYWHTESIAEAKLAIQEILELNPNHERALQLLKEIHAERKVD